MTVTEWLQSPWALLYIGGTLVIAVSWMVYEFFDNRKED